MNCKNCKAHWSEVWTKPKRKSRSHSRKDNKGKANKDKPKETEEALDLFPTKAPWIQTTPSRVVTARIEQATGHGSDLPLPVPPVLKPAPAPPVASSSDMELTAEERKKLTHLRGLKDVYALPEELKMELAMLEKKEAQTKENLLSHGHLNKLKKFRSQVSAMKDKITHLDQEWCGFVEGIHTKFRNHAMLYQQCRAEMMLALNAKMAEYLQYKEECSQASASLLQQQEAPLDMPPTPDLEATFQAFQEVANAAGAVAPIQIEDDEVADAVEMDAAEESEEQELMPDQRGSAKAPVSRVTLQPFRAAPSPSKVANQHLKPKEGGKDKDKKHVA